MRTGDYNTPEEARDAMLEMWARSNAPMRPIRVCETEKGSYFAGEPDPWTLYSNFGVYYPKDGFADIEYTPGAYTL
jgi:hypothetical protein